MLTFDVEWIFSIILEIYTRVGWFCEKVCEGVLFYGLAVGHTCVSCFHGNALNSLQIFVWPSITIATEWTGETRNATNMFGVMLKHAPTENVEIRLQGI